MHSFVIFSLIILVYADQEFDSLNRKLKEQDQKIANLEKQIQFLAKSFSEFQVNDQYHTDNLEFGAPHLLKRWGYINVADAPYNATGNGVTDDTTAIQNALNDAATTGGIVFLPSGNYYIASHLSIPAGVTLKGVAIAPFRTYGVPGGPVVGTTLFAVENAGNPNGNPFISLSGNNAMIEGISIFYPDQTETNPPVEYPWAIGGQGEDLTVKNCFLVNPYLGIDFATNSCPRHYIEGVYGQPLSIGITVDQCYDIGRIKHIHFWPFWSQSGNILNFQSANAVTFAFYRSDWEIVEDVFSWGYRIGMSFLNSQYGALNGQFTDINFDNVDIGLNFVATQKYGVIMSNVNLANAGGGTQHISILGESSSSPAVAVIRGLSVWGDLLQPVLWQNQGLLSLSDSIFMQWVSGNTAITITAGRAMLRGIYFSDTIGTAVNIGPDTDRVMVTDCELVGNAIVNNGADTLVANNHA